MMDKMEELWNLYENTARRYTEELVVTCRNIHFLHVGSSTGSQENPLKNEAVMRLREMRDLRREFMAACGECDDAYISQQEVKFMRRTEFYCDAAATLLDITDKDIDAAELPYVTSTGRKTATPQFPPRFDM